MKNVFHPALRTVAAAICLIAGTSSAANAETLEASLARTRGIIVAPSEQRLASLDAKTWTNSVVPGAAQSSVAITSGMTDAVLPSVHRAVATTADSPFRTPLLLLGGLTAVVLATFGLMLTMKALREDQRRRKLVYRQQFLAGRNGTLLSPR